MDTMPGLFIEIILKNTKKVSYTRVCIFFKRGYRGYKFTGYGFEYYPLVIMSGVLLCGMCEERLVFIAEGTQRRKRSAEENKDRGKFTTCNIR